MNTPLFVLTALLFITNCCAYNRNERKPKWDWPSGSGSGRPTLATTTMSATTTTLQPEINGCIQNCQSRTTNEYNPICGSDRVTYSNPGKLKCAQMCGRSIRKLFTGVCQRKG